MWSRFHRDHTLSYLPTVISNLITNGNPQNFNRRADMATQSSREAALERRKALSDGGKKAASRYGSGSNRVRSATDARPTRTNTPVATAAPAAEARPAASPAPRASRSLSAPSAAPRSGGARRVSNPSRDLVLARRVRWQI